MTFSTKIYNFVPRQQELTAWLIIEPDAPIMPTEKE